MTKRLPPTGLPGETPGVDRWTAARKGELLRRLDVGELGLNDALRQFALTLEEIEEWRAEHPVYRKRALRLGQGQPTTPAQGQLL